MTTCPLCSGPAAVAERLRAGDINRLYRRLLPSNVVETDFSYLVCGTCRLGFFAPPPPSPVGFYEALSRHPWYYQPCRPEFDWAADVIRSRGCSRVLEVGCGSGLFASRLPPGLWFEGIDRNGAAVAAGRQRGLNLSVVSIDEFAGARAEHFDAVCAFHILEHMADPHGFMACCRRLLRPGGVATFPVPNGAAFVGRASNTALDVPPHHATHWNGRALTVAREAAGFSSVRLVPMPLEPMHAHWAKAIAVHARLLCLVRRPFRLVDMRLAGRIWLRLASMIALLPWPLPAEGHTVVACYGR
jgi:SAM-dependent methyltransferase